MNHWFLLLAGIGIAISVAGCAAEESDGHAVAAPAKKAPTETSMIQHAAGEGVEDLPFARGQTFYSLDEYLNHLEKQSAIDLPYWREIRPGVYEHVIRMPGAQREIATREELMNRFGFDH